MTFRQSNLQRRRVRASTARGSGVVGRRRKSIFRVPSVWQTEFAASLSLNRVFNLPDDEFSVPDSVELRGVFAKSDGMNMHRRCFAADNFFLRQIVKLPKTGVVTAEAEQPLAFGMKNELLDE